MGLRLTGKGLRVKLSYRVFAMITLASLPGLSWAQTGAIITRESECKQAFERINQQPITATPTATTLRLLSWNIQKAGDPKLRFDLQQLATATDILILQEAPDLPWIRDLKPVAVFAPGYQTRDNRTGVMVVGEPTLAFHCLFTHREPWLRTPKASSITVFSLPGGRTIAIANIHSINFTLGTGDFRKQLNAMVDVLEHYSGPLVFAGDFNTWSGPRAAVVATEMERLGLSEVPFEQDFRAQVMGNRLDHCFIRGAALKASQTRQFSSSDHNPLLVELTIAPEKPANTGLGEAPPGSVSEDGR